MSDNSPGIWTARVKQTEGPAREFLLAARNPQEVIDLLVEPDYKHLVFDIKWIAPLPFGPGVIR